MDRSIWIRRGRVALVAVGLGAALVGCYRPAEGRFPCETAAECPGGWYCRADDLCWSTPGDAGDPGGDAGPGDAGADAGRDAATPPDGGSDAGPPECSTDAECPSGISQCIEGRCTVCLPAAPSIVDIHTDPDMRDDIDMVLGESADTREIVLAWRGAGTRVYLHRTQLDSPVAPTVVTSDTDAIFSAARVTGVTDVVDVALGAFNYAESSGPIELGVLARDGATGTVLTSVVYTSDSTRRIFSEGYGPVTRTAPDAFLGRIAIDAPLGVFSTGTIILRSLMSGRTTLVKYDTTYLGPRSTPADGSDLTGATASTESHSSFAAMADDLASVSIWLPERDLLTTISTSDRTGEPSWEQSGALDFLLTYPADAQINLRTVDCAAGCTIATRGRADVATGADEVAWVRASIVERTVMLLSAERTGTRWQLVLRAFRDDLRRLTTPGSGSALILDETTTGDFAPVGRFAAGTELDGARRVVAAWINGLSPGDRRLRLVSMPLACE